jgi:ESCRT-I complex subunit TSG101
MQEQIEAIMAREAAEANAAAEAARKAEQAAQEHERQLAAQKLWEVKKKGQLKDLVTQKIYSHLQLISAEAKATVQSDWRDQQLLKLSKETITKEMDELHSTIQNLEESISVVESKTVEIEQWLEESNKSSETKELSVDELCQPDSKLYAQMLDLSSENAAITDALYFLDRGMYMGHIDCTTHLKSVRKLAKRQFLVRAHLMKINQVLIQKGRS